MQATFQQLFILPFTIERDFQSFPALFVTSVFFVFCCPPKSAVQPGLLKSLQIFLKHVVLTKYFSFEFTVIMLYLKKKYSV